MESHNKLFLKQQCQLKSQFFHHGLVSAKFEGSLDQYKGAENNIFAKNEHHPKKPHVMSKTPCKIDDVPKPIDAHVLTNCASSAKVKIYIPILAC